MQYLSTFAEEIALAIKEQRESGTLDVERAVVSQSSGKKLVEKSAQKSTISSFHS
jgi:hypothetical protein